MSKIQLRGHCQVCGRIHATTRGTVAAHGYTIKNGWFSGVCTGQKIKPMEQDRSTTDQVVAAIRFDCLSLRQRAENFASGAITPKEWQVSHMPNALPTPWAELQPWHREEAVKHHVFSNRRRAEIGESVANQLALLVDKVHGQPLIEAVADVAPPPITIGEKRQAERFVLTCTSIQGARIYWKATSEKGHVIKAWTGSSAWRRYPLA